MEQTEEKRKTIEKMNLWGRWISADNGNNKLSYSGQRPEGMEKDCIGSQGPWRTVVVEVQVKAKLSLYRPGQALWAPGGRDSQGISKQSAHEGGKVISPRHHLPLPPRRQTWYSLMLRARFDPTTTLWLERLSPWNILFFGPCIFINKGRTDQRNAQINFSLINLLLFKLLRHVSAT